MKKALTLFFILMLIFSITMIIEFNIQIPVVHAWSWDLLDESWDSVGSWTKYGSQTSEIDPAGQLHQLSTSGYTGRYTNIGGLPAEYTVEFNLTVNDFSTAGREAREFYDGLHYISFALYPDKIVFNKQGGSQEYSLATSTGTWYKWRFLIDSDDSTITVFRNEILIHEFTESLYSYALSDGLVALYGVQVTSGTHEHHEDYFKIASGLHGYIPLPKITFYFNNGGQFRVDNATITNGTQTEYANLTVIELCAITKNSSYVFQSFNWTGGSNATNPALYTVTQNMTVWLYFGLCEGEAQPYIVARFTFNISNPEPNDVIFFNGSLSKSSEAITLYNWTFGDEGSGSGETITHSYSNEGTFTVNLTVTSEAGTDSFMQNITVETDILPYIFARFIFSPSNPAINETIQFNGTYSESSDLITSYFWTFDDGSNSTSATPSHIYTANGTYLVSLNVSSAAGNNIISQNITVGGTRGATITIGYLSLIVSLPFALALALILVKRRGKP